jgi:triacylglycerol esterase/lipase EstA (alpha/beta hydrolase family)
VLLVHGTGSGADEFAWNWVPAFTAAHVPWCTVELVDHALGDAQASAERVVYAVRAMHAMSGRKVAIVGHSQGGMLPRWSLRFWPDIRPMVDDLIGIAASNHGTVVANGYCSLPCPPANWQQRSDAKFIAALNEGAETWAGISYTSVYTHLDEIVFPTLDETGSTSLHTGEGAIANVGIQDVCPLAVTDHIGLGTYDPVAYAIAIDALDHDGPADPARVASRSGRGRRAPRGAERPGTRARSSARHRLPNR